MLLSRVVFVLSECQRNDDFVPAQRILTTSLRFCIEGGSYFNFYYILAKVDFFYYQSSLIDERWHGFVVIVRHIVITQPPYKFENARNAVIIV